MVPRDDYVLTRDFLDNNRITLMHTLWAKATGYLTHPNIPVDKPDLRVADVGTGTAIWLFDLHEKLPKSARLEGLDISFDAAPPKETIPSNVIYRHWNVKEDVPEDLIGAYDVIHVRLFIFVVMDDEILRVVGKLFEMLKPGGYLQWDDADIPSVRVDKARPDIKTEKVKELMKSMSSADPRLNPTWVVKLPRIFEATGFVDVNKDVTEAPPHLAFMMHECNLMLHELFARKTENAALKDNLHRLLPAAVEETKDGAYVVFIQHTVVGRKPEA